MKIDKIRGEGIFEIVHCPSEGWTDMTINSSLTVDDFASQQTHLYTWHNIPFGSNLKYFDEFWTFKLIWVDTNHSVLDWKFHQIYAAI